MFGRSKKDSEDPSGSTAVVTAEPETAAPRDRSRGKGAPTPKRKDQEAARKRPLVPNDRKAAKEANREAAREQRILTRQAMETGDERNLPIRDRGPQRRWVRDYVDARYSIGEFLLPFVILFLVLSFSLPTNLQAGMVLATYGVFGLVIVDGFVLRLQLRRGLTAKFGEVERGVYWYGFMRTLQFRRIRLPKPMVKRRQFPS